MQNNLQNAARQMLDSIVGSQRLEGLEIDGTTLAQLEQVAAGQRNIESVIDSIKARQKAGEFQSAERHVETFRV